ncbi:hypothetical protein COU57_06175 [Candidatus Pacearchaeota archaeon CG10_big_fil_rev_8_21_14_0_10_32_14]|nr:MAG: hypothetical protein COU57_06175 [Candidatus Pacearchaeota archaeon CG10_big_fil_rev_8_21_14_0_10_32_14]
MIFLQSYPVGGNIGDILNSWAAAGFFSYLLPFLLIFAMVFGILSTMNIFKGNRSVDAIVALVVGLMALQFDLVPRFFAEVFPRMAVALSIILVLLILAGFFVDPTKSWIMYTLLGIGAISAVIVLIKTAGSLGWESGYWWTYNWPVVAGAVLLIVIVGIIVGSGRPHTSSGYGLTEFRKP